MTTDEPRSTPPGFSRIGYDTGVSYLAKRVTKWIRLVREPRSKWTTDGKHTPSSWTREAHLEHLHQVTCREVRIAYPEQEQAFRTMYANCRTDEERYELMEYTLNGVASARLWWAWYYQREALVRELGQQGDGWED